MKHLITFKIYENVVPIMASGLTKKQEALLNFFCKGKWIVNPTTGLVDIEGNFEYHDLKTKSFLGIKFGNVTNNFNCHDNRLTSLEGAPQTVGGTFWCSGNNLQSLVGAPKTVGGDFSCSKNKLTSLEGAPQTVRGSFFCYNNKLTSLEGSPQTVGAGFFCYNNKLTSLEGSPQTVDGNFICYNNKLTSLEGAPETLGGNFDCRSNELTSLEGSPHTIDGGFFSDKFQLEQGKWNMQGWLEVLNTGTEEAKKLILTLPEFRPEIWNSKLKENPEATILQMVDVWDYIPKEIQDQIQIPSNWKDSFDNLLDLQRAGIF